VSDSQILDEVRKGKTLVEIINALGFKSTGTSTRIHRIAKHHGLTVRKLNAKKNVSNADKLAYSDFQRKLESTSRKHLDIQNGVVVIGSDAHYWPNIVTTAHRAFVKFVADLQPSAVVLNGDGFDGASISRYPRIGWDNAPSVAEEMDACLLRMGEIEDASSTRNLFWPLGNHDSRYETHLAAHSPQYEGVEGFHLKDKFPLWIPCWSVWVNNEVVIKHRWKGGVHATHNNTLGSGKSFVTGHLHSMKVTPYTDYNGTRYGVDSGTLAEPGGPQFVNYTEDNPTNWRSGFVVLTFHKGQLLVPEVCQVLDEGVVQFRGKVIEV
jgi:hypothetical protein